MSIVFAIFFARLAVFCAHREPFAEVGQAPTCVRPSDMSDLTPELVREWEARLQDPDVLTSGQRYGLECKISKLEASITSSGTTELIKGIARKAKEEAECRLEAYSEPVPVRASTMPKWAGRFTDYSGISVGALEVAHAHLMERIQKGYIVIGKVSKDYKVRGQLIDAGVWDWKAPSFTCAPKGTLKAYYRAIRQVVKEATSVEFALVAAERIQGRETPDTVTTWNTSGLCGPAGGEDTRRFPVLRGNLGWADVLDMTTSTPLAAEVVKCRTEALKWHDRVDGVNFTTPAVAVLHVAF